MPEEIIYELHEVYYDHKGAIEFWSSKPMKPFGLSPDELAKDIEYMREACRLPILNEEDLPGYTEKT